jgi:hypothetical protein
MTRQYGAHDRLGGNGGVHTGSQLLTCMVLVTLSCSATHPMGELTSSLYNMQRIQNPVLCSATTGDSSIAVAVRDK